MQGSNGGQRRQFTSNPGPRRTIPVTAGGCQVSRKGDAKGDAKGEVLCIECIVTHTRYMLNDCSDKMIPVVHMIIARMNASCK
jgi:hypothetical protein